MVGLDLFAFRHFAETFIVGVTPESKQVHLGYVFIWFGNLANTISALQDISKPFVVVFGCLDKFESQARPFIRNLIICIKEIFAFWFVSIDDEIWRNEKFVHESLCLDRELRVGQEIDICLVYSVLIPVLLNLFGLFEDALLLLKNHVHVFCLVRYSFDGALDTCIVNCVNQYVDDNR